MPRRVRRHAGCRAIDISSAIRRETYKMIGVPSTAARFPSDREALIMGKTLRGKPMSQTDDTDGRARNTDRDWKRTLTPDQYRVLREEGTERPFSSALNREKRKGTYV